MMRVNLESRHETVYMFVNIPSYSEMVDVHLFVNFVYIYNKLCKQINFTLYKIEKYEICLPRIQFISVNRPKWFAIVMSYFTIKNKMLLVLK